MPVGRALRWIAPLLALGALIVAGRLLPFRAWLLRFIDWVDGMGVEGMVLYAAVYALVAVLMLPAWLMTVGAGLVFGFLPGIGVVWVGATTGSAAAFLIARYLARDRVASAAAGSPRFQALDRAIGEKGWRIVFLLRMSIVVPYVLSNYVYGLTAIRFWPYLAASAAGMLPVIALYVGLGAAAGTVEGVRRAGTPGPLGIAILAAGVVISLGVTVYVARLTKKAMGATAASAARLP